jgi:tetratricopeptide (TPR) repeat protein/O-antigen ligase
MKSRDDGERHGMSSRPLDLAKGNAAASRFTEVKTGRRSSVASDWLALVAILVVASMALLSGGALFRESSQMAAAAVVLCLGVVVSIRRWSAVSAIARTRLGMLATVNGVVLVIAAILSVYHWASVRELLKTAALAEAFLLGATLVDREDIRDRFLVVFYWWTVAAAGAGCILFVAGMRWPQSWLGSYAVRTMATAANRLSAFFGYANAFAAFLLIPIALGVALAWGGGRRGTAALVGLIVPLVAMQLAASRWGYVVLGLLLAIMLTIGLRLAGRGGFARKRAVSVTGLVLVLAVVSMLVPTSAISTAPEVGQRFSDIGAEVRNTGPEMSSIGGRIAMIRDALRYGAAYPVFGSGPGTYPSTYFRFRSTNFFAADPHSQAMLWLTETGGIGFAAQALLVLALLGLMWLAAAGDAGRNGFMVGAACGITGLVVHAMLDWDFQSFFLPLVVAVFCGMAVPALSHRDTWLLRPWRRSPAGFQATSKPARQSWSAWRPLIIGATSICIVVALMSLSAALVAGEGAAASGTSAAQAVRMFSTAGHLNPLDSEYPYLYAKANIALAASQGTPSIDQSIRDGFQKAIALNPWNIKYQIDEARYLLSKGDVETVAVYENLTRIDPGDPGTFTSLAWAYHLLYQNDAKALKSLDQAFAVDKNYYEAWLVLGRIQEAKREVPEAIASYWKSAEANQTNTEALGSLGSLYEAGGNAAGAARVAFELVLRSPDSASAKSVFAAFGLSMKMKFERVTVDGREVEAVWTISGKPVPETYRLVLVQSDAEETVLADNIGPGLRSVQVSIPRSVPDGTLRLRVYAMAPGALTGVEDPWVSWAESDELVLKTP